VRALSQREVRERTRRFREAQIFAVASDTDDFEALAGTVDGREAASERALARPEAPGERLVDDRDP